MLASASKVRLKAKFDGSSQSAPTDGTVMSEVKPIHLPLSAVSTLPELDDLIERIVQKTLAQVGYPDPSNPFINSKACAELIGVSPEHLCAMRPVAKARLGQVKANGSATGGPTSSAGWHSSR